MHDTNSLCTFTKIEQLKIFDGSQNPDFQVSGSLARSALGAAGTREDGNIQVEEDQYFYYANAQWMLSDYVLLNFLDLSQLLQSVL